MNNRDEQAVDLEQVPGQELMPPAPDNTALVSGNPDAMIALASRLEAMGEAMDRIQRFILSRALSGDFVKFRGADGSWTMELCSAGAERIARDLNISFLNSKMEKVSGSDSHGPFYAWECTCDAAIIQNGREVRKITGIKGVASTRNKFFGYANGEWKPVEDIKDSDLQQAARRAAMKEATRTMLGLRRLSEADSARLGLDMSKVKGVEFTGGGQSGAAKEQAAEGLTTVVKLKSAKSVTRGKYQITELYAADGHKYDSFDKNNALLAIANKAVESDAPVCIRYNIHPQYGRQIKGLTLATAEQIASAKTAAKPETAQPAPAAKAAEPALAELDCKGVKPSEKCTWGDDNGVSWEVMSEAKLKWYLSNTEKQLGGQFNTAALANVQGVQAALVGLGHAPKYKFINPGV